MDSIDSLKDLDDLQEVQFEQCSALIHRDHRWLLCLIHHAQNEGWVPQPSTMVMFDAHHDSHEPFHMDEVIKLRDQGPDLDGLIDLCQNHLNPLDDDWLLAGMELGLIGNAVVFGVQDRDGRDRLSTHRDRRGNEHLLALLGMPLTHLEYQGCLSDQWKSTMLTPLWNSLSWGPSENGRFNFSDSGRPILVDFDLDVFAIRWGDYTLPWPDEVFAEEFTVSSQYSPTRGWTGAAFVQSLVAKAGLLTICTEPDFCGGNLNVRRIAERINRFLFDGALTFPELPM